MKKNILITTLVALAIFGALFGYKLLTIRKALAAYAQTKPVPATVAVATPRQESWHRTLTAVATLQSREGIVVKTEVDGLVKRVAFASGASVKAGDLLVELDTAREEAQLKGLIAAAKLAEVSLNRARELRANGSNSIADLDTAEATFAQAAAAVEQVRVAITKKQITAPFSGRLGITQVNVGQYIKAGDPLVQLEALDPIYADFGLPQQEMPVVHPGLEISTTIDAFPGRTFTGKIQALNPRVSDATRNFRVRAEIPNSDEQLRPGMFGQVQVALAEEKAVLVIPGAAVVYSPYGDSVFVVENGVAKQKFVKTGDQRGDLVAITSGLDAKDQVVIAGHLKLKNGTPTQIDNSVVPDSNPAPKPSES